MGDVDDLLAGLPEGAERAELDRMHTLISAHVPEVGQLRFTASDPLPDRLVHWLLDIRMRLIDDRSA